MVDPDVDAVTCDYCGEVVEPTGDESAFEALTFHFEVYHAGDVFDTPEAATPQRERGAGD